MRGFSSQTSGRARLSASLGLSVGISLCAGALVCGPLATPALAAPTIGGDENGPKVQILQPAYQDVLKGKTKILVAVKSQKFNPQFVEMFVDDKPATPGPISLTTLPSAQYDWDTKLFSDGPHKLMVRVTDTQGFRGWAEVNIFINNGKKVDTLPPSLKWQNVGFQQLSGMASIKLDALDNFGVKWLFISLSKASDPTQKLHSWMLNQPPYKVNIDTTQYPDGLYQLSAKAYDSFEQEGEAPPLKIGIVNNVINATTIGDMLEGLKRVEESSQQVAPKAKPGSRFTVDVPENESARALPKTLASKPNSNPAAPSGATVSAPAPAVSKPVAPKVADSPSVPKPRVVSRPSLTVPKMTPARSLPPMIVRVPPASPQIAGAEAKTTKTQVAKATAPELETTEVAAPQLSNRTASVEAKRSVSGIENEIGGALSEDWRSRFARVGTPDLAPRSESGQLILPQEIARSVDGSPLWSDNDASDTSRVSALAPLKVEMTGGTLQGRPSAPRLVARADVSSIDTSIPQISAKTSVPKTKISARQAFSAKVEALKTARKGKTATPDQTRVAALPRPSQNGARNAINAITVSPLQVNVSNALPAFHVAARSSDLRAVAARYGLPVEVLAANNGWDAGKTLVAGERVQLPKQLKVAYKGVPVQGDAPSMLVGGTGVTAFRFMFEKAGGTLQWDAKKQRVVARKGASEVVLSIGSNQAKVGDKDVMLELAAFLFEGRTMVPLRFFEEGLKAQVEWDPQTGRLVVAMAG